MKIPKLAVRLGTFPKDIWERFCFRYGNHRSLKLIKALSQPVKNYAIRATLTKTSRESLGEIFEQQHWMTENHPLLNDIITVKTKGPFAVPLFEKAPRIIIDKIAAESVFIGANLFGVGIKQASKFFVGDIVSLISQKDQIVATGIARNDSKKPKSEGIAVTNSNSFFSVPSIRDMGLLNEGLAYSQSIPAAYVGHILEPKEGETIVDLCAAPGGKTTSAAILSNNKAKIIAFDRSRKRLNKLEYIVKSQQLRNIEIIHSNSIEYIKNHTLKADKVIVDPSCTALGVRPKVYDETTNPDIVNASNYQKSFLWCATKIVRKGGIITYSTCTTEPEENEKVIAYAVSKLGLKLIEPELKMGVRGEDTSDGLELECMRRFYPDTSDTPGFFVAKLIK